MTRIRSTDLPGAREDQIGADLIEWLAFVRRLYPRPIIDPASDRPTAIAGPPAFLQIDGRDMDETDLFFHVPNGVWTVPRIAASFVAQGLKRGVVDYVWPIRKQTWGDRGQAPEIFESLALELKRARPKGSLSKDQAAFQAAVARVTNWKVVTVWGLSEAAMVLQRYGGYPESVLSMIRNDRPPGRRDVDPWDGRPWNGGS